MNNTYWQQRSLELENAAYKDSEQYKKDLEQLHKETLEQIQKDIAYWYLRFAKKNKITYAEAQRILNANELEEFHWTVQQYIKYGQSKILSDAWRKELENASIKVHVTRLESLQFQMQHHLEKEYAKRITDISHLLKSGLEDDIYKNAYEIEKGLNIGVDLHKYNESEIDDMLKKPWTTDGKVFSERLWGRKQQLVADLVEKDLPQALIRGESNNKIIERWAEKLESDRKAVERVVQTERAYVNSRAALESYKKLGVKKYQILATLDLKTSNICREMDHKGRNKDEPFFYLDEYKVGLTAPPFHCNCRTTTVPYFDDFTEDEKRAMRDEEGKSKKVPADMTYDEWYKKYVKSSPKALTEEKKIKNKSSDNKQYEQYKEILVNEAPKTFDNFQDMKYNNGNEWAIMKDYYKARTEGNISSFSSFSDYKKTRKELNDKLVGVKTSDGVEIKSFSKHMIDRILGASNDPKTGLPRSGTTIDGVLDALKNPLQITETKARKLDKVSETSKKYIGEISTVSINPTTGNLIQSNPTDKEKVRRLKGV